MTSHWKDHIKTFDDRRTIAILGDRGETLNFCVDYFIHLANHAIQTKDSFFVALSGGSTPKAIFDLLKAPEKVRQLDWKKVFVFWSDERSVGPEDPDSNFRMAMQSGFASIPIPPDNIHRMCAETEIEKNALEYEKLIHSMIPNDKFDLVTLGMGDDGHTASLFPHTKGLNIQNRLVIANHIPQKDTWRMTFTYDCINNAHNTCLFVLGDNKADTVVKVLKSDYQPDLYPSQCVGIPSNKALWILDDDAAKELQ